MDKYKLGVRVGSGFISHVYKAFHVDNPEATVALKIMDKQNIKIKASPKQIQTEIAILQNLSKHPNIVRFIETWETKKNIYIVCEFVPYACSELINAKKFTPIGTIQKIILGLCKAVAFLHENLVVHRDIKPENVLLDNLVNDPTAKLVDFGWSKQLNAIDETMQKCCGTLDYLPPEMVENLPYHANVDVWNVGIMAFDLMFKKTPFYYEKRSDTYKAIVQKQIAWPTVFITSGNNSFRDFVNLCTDKNPKTRPNIDKILQHPFLNDK